MNTNDTNNEHPEDTPDLEEVTDQDVIELDYGVSQDKEDDGFITISSQSEEVVENDDFGVLTDTLDTSSEAIDRDDDGDMFEPLSVEDVSGITLEDTEDLAEALVDEIDAKEDYKPTTESNVLLDREQERAVELQLDKPVVLSDVLNSSSPSDDGIEELVEEISDDEVEEVEIEEESLEGNEDDTVVSVSRIPWLIYPIVILGILVRGLQYVKNSVLTSDEASLAYELFNRSLSELFQPLGEQQIAPVGYLIKVKMSSLFFGDSEYTLRLYALASSLMALVLFAWLARKALEPLAAVLAVFIVAFAWPVIHASALLSPLSGDMLCAIFVLMLGVIFMKRELTFKGLVILCVAGAVLIWFSLPLVFVLIGVAAALALQVFSERDGAKFKGVVLVFVVWGLSFIINYFIIIRGYLADDGFRSAFTSDFLPIPTATTWVDSLQWLGTRAVNAFSEPLGIALPGLGLFVFLLGFFVLLRSQRLLILMLILPIVCMLVASALGFYPIDGEYLQFLVPSLALCCAAGLSGLLQVLWDARRRASLALMFLVFVPMVFVAIEHSLEAKQEDFSEALQYWQDHSEIGDVSYIGYTVRNQFHYYTKDSESIDVESIIVGHDNEEVFNATDQGLVGHKRVWLLMNRDESVLLYIRAQLNDLGIQLDEQAWGSDTLWLYDFSASKLQEIVKVKVPDEELPAEDIRPSAEKTVEPANIE